MHIKYVVNKDFCLFITEDGRLYAMGANESGMMGLGKQTKNTLNLAKQVIYQAMKK